MRRSGVSGETLRNETGRNETARSEAGRSDPVGTDTRSESDIRQTVDRVRAALDCMRYGQVVIHVRDGVITQIERSERTRVFQAGANEAVAG